MSRRGVAPAVSSRAYNTDDSHTSTRATPPRDAAHARAPRADLARDVPRARGVPKRARDPATRRDGDRTRSVRALNRRDDDDVDVADATILATRRADARRRDDGRWRRNRARRARGGVAGEREGAIRFRKPFENLNFGRRPTPSGGARGSRIERGARSARGGDGGGRRARKRGRDGAARGRDRTGGGRLTATRARNRQVETEEGKEDALGRGRRVRTAKLETGDDGRNGSSTRAGSSTPKRGSSVENEPASKSDGTTTVSALSVLGVQAPRVVGKRTPRKPSSAYVNFENAAEVLVSLSPQINREAVRAAQQNSPSRSYATKSQIADLALGNVTTPRRKRARALFPDEVFTTSTANGSSPARRKKPMSAADEDTLYGALDGLMTLAENVAAPSPQQTDSMKKKRKQGSGRPRGSYGSPSRHLPPLPKYALKPTPMPVGKKMLKINRPRRHVSREIESVGLGAASSLFHDHRLSETAEATTTTQGDNRARLLIGAHDPLTRRWANANFFTAGTDKGWFEDSGFSRWLQHIGKGDMRVATREEWQKVRRKLPKTRRLSLKFLKDERVDLEYFRHAAREMTNLKLHGTVLTDELKALMLKWTGGVPVPSPLEVGQTVLAVHPRFHSPYIGNILIVERATCRVQFARPELGVELVRDIDIMPVDANQEEMDLIAAGTAEQIENEAFNAGFRGIYDPLPVVGGGGHAYGAGVAVAAQMREMDVRLLNEAQQALERKRELVDALRMKNDAAEEFKKKPERVKQAAETNGEALKFQREYAAIVLALRGANAELEGALVRLRQQQGYHDKPLGLWRKIKSQNLGDGHRALSRFAPPSATPSSDELYASTAEDIVATAGMGARRIVYHVQTTTNAGAESTATLNPSLQEPLGTGATKSDLPPTAADVDAEKLKVTQLVTAIVQAALTIKACADRGASASVLDACLRRVSDSLRPVAVNNRAAFDAVERALKDLRDVFLIR